MNADKNSHQKSPTRFFKLGIYFLAAYVLLVGALGWWWDKEPERFDGLNVPQVTLLLLVDK